MDMLKVLLIDDEPFIVQGLAVLIDWSREGFEIAATAANGREALEYLQDHKVDLIIADIKMPVMGGLELLDVIRSEKVSEAYFVILSGYSDFAFARQAIQQNCMDYVLKPVEREELTAILRKVAQRSAVDRMDEQNQKKMERAYLERNVLAMLFGKHDGQNLEYVKRHMHLSEGVRYINIEPDGLRMFRNGRMGNCGSCRDGSARHVWTGLRRMKPIVFSMFHRIKRVMISAFYTATIWRRDTDVMKRNICRLFAGIWRRRCSIRYGCLRVRRSVISLRWQNPTVQPAC